RGRWVVVERQELALDHVADHGGLGRAQQVGGDVVTDGGDERQQRAGEDARQRQRQRHLHERARTVGVQVERGLEQPFVDLLEADVERQRHERQVIVTEVGYT